MIQLCYSGDRVDRSSEMIALPLESVVGLDGALNLELFCTALETNITLREVGNNFEAKPKLECFQVTCLRLVLPRFSS
jgi:hypothetical protein